MNISLFHPSKHVKGNIDLGGSKSISNRVLIIRHLCKDNFEINNLSESDDTKTLIKILNDIQTINDVHHAGTTFRFLTSLLCITNGEQILTGSKRMLQRPIGPLVDALRDLGADINYLEENGYPPIQIKGQSIAKRTNAVKISGEISSQFITSLL